MEYGQGNLAAAHDDLSRAVQLMPGGLTYFTLGRVVEDQGDLKSAANLYEKATKASPDMADAQARLDEVLLKMRQTDSIPSAQNSCLFSPIQSVRSEFEVGGGLR